MCTEERKQGTRQEGKQKSSRELGKKVCKEGSKELGKKVCKRSSKEIGKSAGMKRRKELKSVYARKVARN